LQKGDGFELVIFCGPSWTANAGKPGPRIVPAFRFEIDPYSQNGWKKIKRKKGEAKEKEKKTPAKGRTV